MPKTTTQQFKKQLPRNVIMNILGFVAYFASGICLVPYLVRSLGKEAYGLIPIAAMLTQYVALVTVSISSAVTRFLSIEIQKKDHDAANQVYNTAFFSYLAFVVIQVPLFILAVVYVNNLVNVPLGILLDVRIMLGCSALVFLLGILTGPAAVSPYAMNRLDLIKTIDIACLFARIILIVAVFSKRGPALRYIGYIDLGMAILRFSIIVAVSKRLTPYLRISFSFFQWSRVKELLSMGVWVVINTLGAILYLRMDVWVVNRFISPEEAGSYAALIPWSGIIRQIAGMFVGVVGPMLIIYYARNEMSRFVNLGKMAVKSLTLIVGLLVGLICGFREPLLKLWLGQEFVLYAPLLLVMISHLVLNVGVLPLFNMQVALNKVRIPGIVTLCMGVINFGFAIFLIKTTNLGIFAPAIAGAVMLSVKNLVFTPAYVAHIQNLKWFTFMKPMINGIILGAVVFSVSTFLSSLTSTWTSLLLIGGVIGSAGVFLATGLFITRDEKKLILSMLPQSLRPLMGRFMLVRGDSYDDLS